MSQEVVGKRYHALKMEYDNLLEEIFKLDDEMRHSEWADRMYIAVQIENLQIQAKALDGEINELLLSNGGEINERKYSRKK